MAVHVDAVYENGVLRPLQPLDLKEHEHVVVSVVKAEGEVKGPRLAVEYIERLKRELGDDPIPSLEEVRKRLSKIPGSMADVESAEKSKL